MIDFYSHRAFPTYWWKYMWKYLNTIFISPKISTADYWIDVLSHSTAIPRRWHGDLKFLRAPWDRTKILKNIANNFTFSITWKCHGAPTATVVFPRSAHGVPPRSHGVLAGDWLRSHGALTACSGRAKSCHWASTACTQRARRVQCVSTASSRSVYEHMRKQVLQAYCRNRHAYKRE